MWNRTVLYTASEQICENITVSLIFQYLKINVNSNLFRSLAAEWGRYGIRFNAIAPGPIETEVLWMPILRFEFDYIINHKAGFPSSRTKGKSRFARKYSLVENRLNYLNSDALNFNYPNMGNFLSILGHFSKTYWEIRYECSYLCFNCSKFGRVLWSTVSS